MHTGPNLAFGVGIACGWRAIFRLLDERQRDRFLAGKMDVTGPILPVMRLICK